MLTKFGADWLIFVDARVLTRKLWTDGWTDGQTKSDHNSSLSTPCSGELKNLRMSNDLHIFRHTIMCLIKQIVNQMKAIC